MTKRELQESLNSTMRLSERRGDIITQLQADLAAVRAELAASRKDSARLAEAMTLLRTRLSCGKHTGLRHPLCGDCQALGAVENALRDHCDAAMQPGAEVES